jgi:acyl-CoA thioester hydrolase
MISVDARVRVRYAETDQMGVVYHANYLIWMEVGRVEYWRTAGLRYRDMERDGILPVVAEANCRYRAPAFYDEEIVIQTRIAEINARMMRFDYEMRAASEDGSGQRVIAVGYTKHIFCGRDRRPCRMPEKYHEILGIKPSETILSEKTGESSQ